MSFGPDHVIRPARVERTHEMESSLSSAFAWALVIYKVCLEIGYLC